jgi:outer membrane protein assembly factor BamC
MRFLLPVLFSLLSVGCTWLTGDKGYFRDTTDDYRNARVYPALKVPKGLDDDGLQDIYVIPAITEDLRVTGTFETPRPAPLAARETEELVRIQRLGEEEWMLVAVAPGQLWPQVRAFLTTNSLQLARVDARAGLIETGWLKPDHGGMDERYQFRIEQGVQRNTSELHVRQMALAGDTDSWPETSVDGEREKEMLMAVAQFIASNTDAAPVSMMAQQAITATGKVSMQEDADSIAYMRLELPYHRAWASVERALQQSNFRVRDRDRSSGVYYIRYVEEDEGDSGWFDWLFSGDDQAATPEMTDQDFVLTLEKQSPDVVRITIGREDKEALTPAQSQSLLGLIKGNIS